MCHAVDISRSTVPGVGALHHFRTRGGQRFAVLVDRDGGRTLLVYGPAGAEDADEPRQQIVLDLDEADEVAGIVGSRSVPDRLAELERRLAELDRRAS